MVSNWLHHLERWFNYGWAQGWHWVDTLDRQEWLTLLALVTILGFFCMRGYGSRMHH